MIQDFYDDLTPFYHLIFPNWENSIQHQAEILDGIIREQWPGTHTIVDVTCGIGTQSIGLARKGYQVEASDLSPAEIHRARIEAEKRGVTIPFAVSDMREAHLHFQKQFDLVISCDNAIPHLPTDSEIVKAFKAFLQLLKPGGGCLITQREYEKVNREGIPVDNFGVRVEGDAKYIIFQTWHFEGDHYNFSMYFTRDDGGDTAETRIFRARYYAIATHHMAQLMEEAGFVNVKRIESDYYQPVIIGTRPR